MFKLGYIFFKPFWSEENKQSSISFLFDTLILWLLKKAKLFFSAKKISFFIGSRIKADLNSPSILSATEIAKWGIPCKKLVVPSIGSIIQTLSLSLFSIFPDSSDKKE